MKTYLAGLQASTQTSYSNNGKTTILGRAAQKMINSNQVIGPTLTQFIDVQTLAGFAPSYCYFNPATNHLFVLGAAAANPTIALFSFNNSTGAYSYVGKLTVWLSNVAVTTHSFKGFEVYETGGAIYPLISTTGSVVINGGTFVAWGLATSDFTVSGGTIIWSASGSNQKAVYFLQDSSALGQSHVATTTWGLSLPQASSSSGVNTKVWQWNGTLALPQLYSWDLSGTPTVAGIILNGVSAQTTLYVGTSPSAYFTMGASNNGYANTDTIVLMNGSGNVPTAFTSWNGASAQVAATNTYFIRDLQLVSGNYYFNLSTTSGGAAVVPTSSTSSFTLMRAFGINSNLFSLKTGILPAFTTGSLLTNQSVGYAKPVSAPANTALNGQDCIYMAASTALYMGKISELTSGVTSWPSMTSSGINITGTGIDITVPTVGFAAYSGQNQVNDIDRWIYVTNTSTYVVKPYQTSIINTVFGGVTDTYYETLNPVTVQTGSIAVTSIDAAGGWLFSVSNTIGQRGIIFVDLYSDSFFANTEVISPVLSVPAGSVFKYINGLEQLFDYTDSMAFYIRSASTSTDSSFNSSIGGWTLIKVAADLSATTIGPFFQFMVQFDILTLDANTPAQLQDIEYTVQLPGESSDNWNLDNDNTTQGSGSPSYASFYLQTAYASVVPTLYSRVYDTSGNLIFSANTSSNPSSFQYSTNGGTSWTSLGTIPNTVGTRVRVLVTPTPAVVALPSIRES